MAHPKPQRPISPKSHRTTNGDLGSSAIKNQSGRAICPEAGRNRRTTARYSFRIARLFLVPEPLVPDSGRSSPSPARPDRPHFHGRKKREIMRKSVNFLYFSRVFCPDVDRKAGLRTDLCAIRGSPHSSPYRGDTGRATRGLLLPGPVP